MASPWDDLVSHIINDSQHQSLAPLLLMVMKDIDESPMYVEDFYLDETTSDELKRTCCQEDPDWALESIKGTFRCDRCNDVCIDEDKEQFRMKIAHKKFELHTYCEDCYNKVSDMEKEYDTDDDTESEEEDVDEKVEREVEWASELSMGK
jgi:hypothetical protein